MSLLNPLQIEAAKVFIETSAPKDRKQGRVLANGSVSEVHQSDEDEFVGVVVDSARGKKQKVKLSFILNEWEGECSCSEAFDCSHCVAVLHALMVAEGSPQPSPEPPSDEDPSDIRALVTHRLGRSITAAEGRVLTAIELILAKHGSSTQIPECDLAPVLGDMLLWSWERIQAWPKPPANAWQAWLYIAHVGTERKRRLPEFLASITTPSEIAAMVSQWEREKAIIRWSDWLAETAAALKAPETVDLLLVLGKKSAHLEFRSSPQAVYKPVKTRQIEAWLRDFRVGDFSLSHDSAVLWREFTSFHAPDAERHYSDPRAAGMLNAIFRTPGLDALVLNPARKPFRRASERLSWQTSTIGQDYRFTLALPDGTPPPPLLVAIDGSPALYVSHDEIFECAPLSGLSADPEKPAIIPAPALESSPGVALLDRIGKPVPEQLEKRISRLKSTVRLECTLDPWRDQEMLEVKAIAKIPDGTTEHLCDSGWNSQGRRRAVVADRIIVIDRSVQSGVRNLLTELGLKWDFSLRRWRRPATKKFPAEWVEWLASVPKEIELKLDPLLGSLNEKPVMAEISLDVEEAGIDWFDVRVKLNVAETELTPQEIQLLLDARGGYVRLGDKGWRRLEYKLDPDDEESLADMGLNARDLSGESQRFHALQLAGKRSRKMVGTQLAEQLTRRAAEIKTSVAPPIPTEIQATLRPYQEAGFHFLAYLTTNNFGGVLADDMGLGKTVQTLAWIAWLRSRPDFKQLPILVVCPKSVTDTWRTEAARFYPALRTLVYRLADGVKLKQAVKKADLVVVNYTQLRIEDDLTKIEWAAVILDEAQYIKNPTSQTAQAACSLKTTRRLALSGTPIENRLLDLWSIMSFAMPGALGTRASFGRTFDQKADPFARRRLSARVRPFVLRRTKGEVAKDLPERIEEDVFCELEGEQSTLYTAELKRARLALLKIKTTKELDSARFNILTSLLRLRQICCHPRLVKGDSKAESAKLNALLDLLEPLMEEGHKVLVFSQFVGMIELIQAAIAAREWHHFVLTGETEERGELVADFQTCEGSAVFLISLRAGGFGLNLTAASYVVLYDPWWNPAVENQAIDRTHRIGQTNRVVAYRLIIKESIEEKIRSLQKQKSVLAADILGEENFARALSLDDFKFLIG